jgi:hypothetical protein
VVVPFDGDVTPAKSPAARDDARWATDGLLAAIEPPLPVRMPPPVREVDDAKPGRGPVAVDDANADAGPARASSALLPAAGPAFARGKVHSRNLSFEGVAGIESASLLL